MKRETLGMGTVDLRRFDSAETLAQAASGDWLSQIPSASSAGTRFHTALSGGRIAHLFFSSIAAQGKARRLHLATVRFFWSDERCVPPDDPESNFRAAYELLLKPLAIPPDQIHRIKGELPPEQAAAAAESEVRQMVRGSEQAQPIFDLVLLGMGEDGHVASLFPGEPEELINSPLVFRPVRAVKPPPLRITMGYATIATATQVWVLASGSGKEAALAESLRPGGRTPLGRLVGLRASTRIYSDCRI